MQCRYCGKEVEQIPGKKTREYCSDSHRQLAYVKRHKQEKPAQPEEIEPASLRAQLADKENQVQQLTRQISELRTYVRDKDVEIDDQAATIARLRLHLDIEKRYLTEQKPDNKIKRPFKTFLKKQPATPLITKLLADTQLQQSNTHNHYRYRLLHHFQCSEEEMQEFANLWKLMLLESPF